MTIPSNEATLSTFVEMTRHTKEIDFQKHKSINFQEAKTNMKKMYFVIIIYLLYSNMFPIYFAT